MIASNKMFSANVPKLGASMLFNIRQLWKNNLKTVRNPTLGIKNKGPSVNPALGLAGHNLRSGLTSSIHFFAYSTSACSASSGGGKGLIHSHAFKHVFTVFIVRDKNVGH